MIRPQFQIILDDLKKKMVLLVGPRQSGKTTLAKQLMHYYQNPLYLNYDHIKDRTLIQEQLWLPESDFLILDELHKMHDWKNYLKGLYDTKPEHQHILVTGSARLDLYDQIGDSLAGRYFRHRLLPLSLAELYQAKIDPDLQHLIERGGFPEPYFSETNLDAKRWRAQYINSILSTDIFEVDNIQNLKAFRTVFDLLRHKVGSPISYQSLAEDTGVSPTTIKKYIEILTAVYVIFVVTPFSKNIARSLLKEPKVYFFDCALVEGGAGPILENTIAVSLLKNLYALNDQCAENNVLHYLRTKDSEEVDFAICNQQKVQTIIEVKVSDASISRSLYKFQQRYHFESIQLVQHLKHEYQDKNIKVLNALNYLRHLYL
jgi:predicted AAA+ superfamily ATPase